ncbi:(Fe-S)-binding protein [Xanthobacter sp. KR7-225]|uniref:(Fe-S)-binding protein n=1 Tax=Xanthobacter sp. KR7-225 TaxID=3156613 RepID=UPI0032B396D3
MDFTEALDIHMNEIASACTRCGKCFQACPMTGPAGIGDAEPAMVVSGIVEILRGAAGTVEADAWASACSSSGNCIPACDYGVNPRTMVRLAHFASTRRRSGEAVKANAMKSFRAMAKAVRIVSRLQIDADLLHALQPPPGRDKPARRPDVLIYTGCNVHKTPHILILCLDVIRAMGLSYEVVGGPSACCGVFQFLSGDAETSGRAGLGTLSQIEAIGARETLSWCPSCQTQFDDVIIPNHQRMSRDDAFALTPFFLFLERHIEQLRELFVFPVRKRVALNERPGYPGVMQAVKRILHAIPELEFVELDVPRVGLMSNYLTVAPRFKDELREREFRAAADAGVTTLATVFHACHRELCHFERTVSFEIVNVMELIGESMGAKADDIYKRLKMMNDVEAMIDDCGDLIRRHGLDPDEARDVLLADQLAATPLQGHVIEK